MEIKRESMTVIIKMKMFLDQLDFDCSSFKSVLQNLKMIQYKNPPMSDKRTYLISIYLIHHR